MLALRGWKNAPYARCKQCGLQPQGGSEDELRSVYFSLGRIGDSGDRDALLTELQECSNAIRAGETTHFSPDDLKNLEMQRDQFRSIRYSQVWAAVFRLFLPAFIFLSILWIIVAILRFRN